MSAIGRGHLKCTKCGRVRPYWSDFCKPCRTVKPTQAPATTTVAITSRWTDNFEYSIEVPTGEETAMLETAYALTSRDDRPLRDQVCATSIGDILRVNGKHFVLDRLTWTELSPGDVERWKQIDCRDASAGVIACRAQHLF